MLKLTDLEYIEATEKLAKALERAEEAGMRTFVGRAGVMLEALGNDFDVSIMDTRDDTISDVWPEQESAPPLANFYDFTVPKTPGKWS